MGTSMNIVEKYPTLDSVKIYPFTCVHCFIITGNGIDLFVVFERYILEVIDAWREDIPMTYSSSVEQSKDFKIILSVTDSNAEHEDLINLSFYTMIKKDGWDK